MPARAAAKLARHASQAASAAVARIGRELGIEMTAAPGAAAACPRDLGAALRIARQLEHPAREEVRGYFRRARGADQSWHEIGALLGVGVLAADAGATVADMALD